MPKLQIHPKAGSVVNPPYYIPQIGVLERVGQQARRHHRHQHHQLCHDQQADLEFEV